MQSDDPRLTIIEALATGYVMTHEDATELVDQLVGQTDAWEGAKLRASLAGARCARDEAQRERDLLRDRYAAAWDLEVKQTAVVEAARAWRQARDDPARDDAHDEMDAVYVALDALDGSGEAADG